jgi:pimeloyl-CoA synthetase
MKHAPTAEPVAPKRTIEEIVDELVRKGVISRGSGKLPPDFLTRKLPKFDGSVVEQLLEDRRKNDW